MAVYSAAEISLACQSYQRWVSRALTAVSCVLVWWEDDELAIKYDSNKLLYSMGEKFAHLSLILTLSGKKKNGNKVAYPTKW